MQRSRPEIVRPLIAAAVFFLLTVSFTYYFNPAATNRIGIGGYGLTIPPKAGYFLSSPFNMQTEGNPLYNLYLPTILFFMLGVYLKNFNTAFQKKCNLRAVFLMAVAASYLKSWGSMFYYRGYSDFGISLGTSIITLCFLAVFVISLEVYIERKERYEHLYGHFLFTILSSLIVLLAVLIFFSFFASSSFVVHAMGLTAFLIIFIPYYERDNIERFLASREERLAAAIRRKAETGARK